MTSIVKNSRVTLAVFALLFLFGSWMFSRFDLLAVALLSLAYCAGVYSNCNRKSEQSEHHHHRHRRPKKTPDRGFVTPQRRRHLGRFRRSRSKSPEPPQPLCRYGRQCTRRRCRFRHPEGRVQQNTPRPALRRGQRVRRAVRFQKNIEEVHRFNRTLPANTHLSANSPGMKKKQQQKRGDVTLIGMCIDRSGSMSAMGAEVKNGFNMFIQKQRDDTAQLGAQQRCHVTVFRFDDKSECVCDNVDVASVPTADDNTFEPRGMTALFDGIGDTLDRLEAHEAAHIASKAGCPKWASGERPAGPKCICVILTDGQENSSQRFTRDQIRRRIDQLKARGWEFVFLAANQDAVTTAASMGIGSDSAMTFDSTPQTMHNCFTGSSAMISRGRRGGGFSFNDAERRMSSPGTSLMAAPTRSPANSRAFGTVGTPAPSTRRARGTAATTGGFGGSFSTFGATPPAGSGGGFSFGSPQRGPALGGFSFTFGANG